jgi:hypothetical protein
MRICSFSAVTLFSSLHYMMELFTCNFTFYFIVLLYIECDLGGIIVHRFFSFFVFLMIFLLLTGCNQETVPDPSKGLSYKIIDGGTINRWNNENKLPGKWFFDTLSEMSENEIEEGIAKLTYEGNTYILIATHMEASAKVQVRQIDEEENQIIVVAEIVYPNGQWGGGIGYEGLLLRINETDKEIKLKWHEEEKTEARQDESIDYTINNDGKNDYIMETTGFDRENYANTIRIRGININGIQEHIGIYLYIDENTVIQNYCFKANIRNQNASIRTRGNCFSSNICAATSSG